MTRKKPTKSTQIEKITERYTNLELELKGKGDPVAQAKIAEIENQIFEDIKNIIDEYERDQQKTIKHKIIIALKNRS